MITTPAPATPFHRLARTAAHRWWRPVVGTVMVVAAWILTGTTLLCLGALGVAAATGALDTTAGDMTAGGRPDSRPVPQFAGGLLFIALVTPVVLLAARWIQKRPSGTLSSVLGRLRYGWLRTCLLLALAPSTLAVVAEVALLAATGRPVFDGADAWVGWAPFAASMAVVLLLVPLQASGEEYLCRGWLLQAVGAFGRRPWLAVAVQALVFAAAHAWQGGVLGFIFFAIFGVVTGVLAVRTGGLEAGIAIHITNNVVALAMQAAVGGLDRLSVTSFDWQVVAVPAVFLLGYAVVVLRLARRRGIAVVVPEAPQVAQTGVPVLAG